MGRDGMQSLVMLGAMVLIFYFFLIRPQARQRKALKNFRENLKAGDKVVTIGGIHGKILEVSDTTVLVQAEGTKIRFEKSAIAQSSEDQIMMK